MSLTLLFSASARALLLGDEQLAAAMRELRREVHEEVVLEELLQDLAAACQSGPL